MDTTEEPTNEPEQLSPEDQVLLSRYLSRDLSWLRFNQRVLDQSRHIDRNVFDRLKFLAITASNLDEFCTIRIGSLYNYLDFGKERFDYSGLREEPFRKLLFSELHGFAAEQHQQYAHKLKPLFEKNRFRINSCPELSVGDAGLVNQYFTRTIFPMLTPMVFDNYHAFPMLKNNRLIFGVVTVAHTESGPQNKASFIQIPSNQNRFFELLLFYKKVFTSFCAFICHIFNPFVHSIF